MVTITTTDAARLLNRSRSWVQRECSVRGIGRKIHSRLRILTHADLRRLAKIPLKKPGPQSPAAAT